LNDDLKWLGCCHQIAILKADKMKEQANQLKDSGFVRYLLSPVIVGFVVLLGQSYIAPKVAREVKREESILEQRYKACENAVNILQRRLASVTMTGKDIPEWYIPPEKTPPTQVETNVVYNLLVIYGKSDEIAEQFYKAAIGEKKIDPQDIVKFISAVRKELGVDEKGFTGQFKYIFIRQGGEDGQKDGEPKDEQKQ
jgi:hypothetical protein